MKLDLERVGLGYRAFVSGTGIGLHINRLVESRGELSGELSVAMVGPGDLTRQRFNLTSGPTRSTLAKSLQARAALNGTGPRWDDILEAFCVAVLDTERQGPGVVDIGTDDMPPRPEVAFLVKPLVLDGPVATILYGFGMSGKSTIAAACAVAVATGSSTFTGWEVGRQTKVLVLDWETSAHDWNDTISGIAKGAGLERPRIGYMACDRPLPSMIEEVTKMVSERDIGFVIVDSAGMAMPNARDGAGAEEGAIRLFKAVRLLAVPTLVIDHRPKEGKGPYGSVYKGNAARAVWEAETDQEDDSALIVLRHVKHNLTGRFPAQALRLVRSADEILLVPEEVPLNGRQSLAAQEEARGVKGRIAAALRDASGPLTFKELSEGLDIDVKVVAVTVNRDQKATEPTFILVRREGREAWWTVRSQQDNTTDHNMLPIVVIESEAPADEGDDGLGTLFDG